LVRSIAEKFQIPAETFQGGPSLTAEGTTSKNGEQYSRIIIAKQHYINPWELVQVNNRIGLSSTCYSRSKMDVIPSMKEVRASHETNPFPFKDGGSRANEENQGILETSFGWMSFDFLRWRKPGGVGWVIPGGWLIDSRV